MSVSGTVVAEVSASETVEWVTEVCRAVVKVVGLIDVVVLCKALSLIVAVILDALDAGVVKVVL